LRGFFDLDQRKAKVTELEAQTVEEGFWNDNQSAQTLLKEVSRHKKWIETIAKMEGDLADADEFTAMVEETSPDIAEIKTSLDVIGRELDKLEFQAMLSGPDDHRDAIMTIHPGAGGTESQDWADMLFRMYNRWAERRQFSISLMDYQPGDEAGLKSATMEIKGDYAYGFLQAESGVHRLVRISPYDAASRRHTSFASIHVFPVVEDNVEIEIKDEDIRLDTYRASGAGGQHVNKTSSAVRITHLPTNIVVTCQSERSQFKNKDAAFTVLKARLYQRHKEEEAKKREVFDKTKKKIEWGSQIRSYVFHPYNMVKDHRTSKETSNVQAVMDGDIDQFVEAFLSDPEMKEQYS
jgi:peptide chain release factor 2